LRYLARSTNNAASYCAAFSSRFFVLIEGPNIFHVSLLSNTLHLCLLLTWEIKYHTHVKAGEIVFPYILVSVFIGFKRENKTVDRMVAGTQFKSALKLFLHAILIYLCPVQIL
jgi:hypothetical protein